MKCYIDFLDSEKNFQQTRKDFETYDDAVAFLRSNFERFDVDMINYL